MTKHRRKKKSKVMSWIVGLTLALFVLAIFTFLWDFFVKIAKPLAWTTGILLVIFLLFKLVTINQIGNKIGRKIGV